MRIDCCSPIRRTVAVCVCVLCLSLGLTVSCFGLPGRSVAGAQDSVTESQAVMLMRQTLDAQVEAWNRGDIPGFMQGYVRDETLRFSSGGTTQRGWQAALDRYLKTYPNRDQMGQLKFSDLEFLPLSDQYAEVFGKYHLSRSREIGDATGLFTLLMQKEGKRWLVLHDHTSSAK